MDAIVECVAWDDARQGSANADATRTPRPFSPAWTASRVTAKVKGR